MTLLPQELRISLDRSVVQARDQAEAACAAALRALGVEADQAPSGIANENRALRNALRAKQRQLGGSFEQLVSECAYEQWHLMLFARFLAENELLIHPTGAHVTLDEVAELAREEGENDPWMLAARYAATMLPGIFKPADPCVGLPLAPEGRKALEDILAALPGKTFSADDALGWVYQFWQSKKKKEVNASERKVGPAELPPVTQLFTEHYMVRFLLENSLGAWWAARHPGSPLLSEWGYLRLTDEGEPAAGRFEGWPETVAEITVMDPCCGSGHFLVAAFEMLRKMREEEDGLSELGSVDAVLRDNLYGLELDPRCIQIAALNLALAAWKVAGYHELPSLNLACSGIPTRGSLEEWTKLAGGDERLERALTRLHELFREADTLGSLIDPRRAVEDGTLLSVPFDEVAPLLEKALANDPDPVAAVFGESAREVARAASLLAGSYTLVATNPPFLGRRKQNEVLRAAAERVFLEGRGDVATMMLRRALNSLDSDCSLAFVLPQNWLFLKTFRPVRERFLQEQTWNVVARLGSGAFGTISGEVVTVSLHVFCKSRPRVHDYFLGLDASNGEGPRGKSIMLRARDGEVLGAAPPDGGSQWFSQSGQLDNPGAAIVLERTAINLPRVQDANCGVASTFEVYARSYAGIQNGDAPRYQRLFWELDRMPNQRWAFEQTSPDGTSECDGLTTVIDYDLEEGHLRAPKVWRRNQLHDSDQRGKPVWGKRGVLVSRMRDLPSTLYLGGLYDQAAAAVVPNTDDHLAAVWAFCSSPQFHLAVRSIDQKLNVTSSTLTSVPFDLPYWQQVAEEQYPNGLPDPCSDDPTQWLFKGIVVSSEQPLHVALSRLLGYRWPDQEPDKLDGLADEDGIVCLPPVAGERPAHERLRALLVAAYGESFSQQTLDDLLAPEGSTTLEDWLRDRAFASHAKLFHNRPFIWHIWDGRKDGFAALVNYHKLDHQTLEKLAFTHLNWWIERQQTDMAIGAAGAEARLAAAGELQAKLKLVLEGEDPYDIFVRWKPLAEQPLGWEPDLNDGVRLNIRPFVTAGVLRARLPINWNKDRGKNPDDSDRHNDLHTTLAAKRAAREDRRSCD